MNTMTDTERLVVSKIRRNLNMLAGLPEDDMRRSDENVKEYMVRMFGQAHWDRAVAREASGEVKVAEEKMQQAIDDMKEKGEKLDVLKAFSIFSSAIPKA